MAPLSEIENRRAYEQSWAYVFPGLRALVNVVNLQACYDARHSHGTRYVLKIKGVPSSGTVRINRACDPMHPTPLLDVIKHMAHDQHHHIHHLNEQLWEPTSMLALLLANSCLHNNSKPLLDAAARCQHWKNGLKSHNSSVLLSETTRDEVFKAQLEMLQEIVKRVPTADAGRKEQAEWAASEFQHFFDEVKAGSIHSQTLVTLLPCHACLLH